MRIDFIKTLLICLLVVVFSYFFYLDHSFDKKLQVIESDLLQIKEKIKNQANLSQENNKEPFIVIDGKTESFRQDDNFKEFQKLIVDYLSKNINKIVPEKPTVGSNWVISKVDFFSPEVIKVVYEDGHDQEVIFLKIETAYNSEIVIKPFY